MPVVTIISPVSVYLDESIGDKPLAPRPSTLDGKVVGLLPNWRPVSMGILEPIGALLKKRFRLKGLVMEAKQSKVLTREQLDDLKHRVDVVITASGD